MQLIFNFSIERTISEEQYHVGLFLQIFMYIVKSLHSHIEDGY